MRLESIHGVNIFILSLAGDCIIEIYIHYGVTSGEIIKNDERNLMMSSFLKSFSQKKLQTILSDDLFI